uniref:Uncharacterized protein n=1 Tax=Timema genevievae TaxID=629358 RepID=A0A7R9JTM4_TIMGE|nr:unnamed protein product [Timema genevievae]
MTRRCGRLYKTSRARRDLRASLPLTHCLVSWWSPLALGVPGCQPSSPPPTTPPLCALTTTSQGRLKMSRQQSFESLYVEMFIVEIEMLPVKSVHPYGAFVQMPGAVVQGLVHRTQVSSVSVSDVSEVLQPGERVWCKVINITDDNKLALSMKVVDQGNGMDLDPNGVQIEQDERRRKAHPSGTGRRIIELGAVLNTTCSKCGVHGHLANECFRSPNGKTYSLVEEEKDDMPTLVSEPPQEVKHWSIVQFRSIKFKHQFHPHDATI